MNRRPLLPLVVLALLVPLHARAATEWVVTPTDATRWADPQSPVTVHLVVGDEVEVLATQGTLVRVRRGTDFGWVAPKVLTTDAPPKSADAPEPN